MLSAGRFAEHFAVEAKDLDAAEQVSLSVGPYQMVKLFEEAVDQLEMIGQFFQRKSEFPSRRHPILLSLLLAVVLVVGWIVHVQHAWMRYLGFGAGHVHFGQSHGFRHSWT